MRFFDIIQGMENKNPEEITMNVYQVGSELGMSTNTVLRYIRDYDPYIPFDKEGRSYRFTPNSLSVFQYIRKLVSSRKNHEQILVRLSKKYPEVKAPEVKVMTVSPKKGTTAPKKKPGSQIPLLERVSTMELRLGDIEKSIQKLEKRMDKNENNPGEFGQELKRLKKLIEG